MDRNTQAAINARYDALMFATSPEAARKAARELVQLVLGDEAANRPLEESLRTVCRRLRPSDNPAEQARFEAEFVELAFAPTSARTMAA
jgi:hypothetical protein